MEKYLAATRIIDWNNPEIIELSKSLSSGKEGDIEIARSCFEYVRDEIKHSKDYKLNPVTCRASEVLKYKTGYCYAKSHLLAALLRANNIPAGLCYQRLTVQDDIPPYCLHGLNAVYLSNYGWYRIDARGNKEGVSAEFLPPIEKLAFSIKVEGEVDLPEIWDEPIFEVVKILEGASTYQEVAENLPDIELITS